MYNTSKNNNNNIETTVGVWRLDYLVYLW